MCVWVHCWEVLRIHGILKGYRNQSRKNTSYNGASSTKDSQESAEPGRQDNSPKQIRLKGDGQMPTLLSRLEEIVRMNKRVPASVQKSKVVSFIASTVQPIYARGSPIFVLSSLVSRCQRGFIKRRGWVVEARLLHEPRVSRSGRRVSLNQHKNSSRISRHILSSSWQISHWEEPWVALKLQDRWLCGKLSWVSLIYGTVLVLLQKDRWWLTSSPNSLPWKARGQK